MTDRASPSWTARGAAVMRAAHRLDDEPRIFDDPYALGLTGLEDEAHLRAVLEAQAMPDFARMRMFFAVRSRYTEDCLRAAGQRGVTQYVILGAGLDSFAYRAGDLLDSIRVYEVDRPADQEWKRERLAAMGVPIPRGLVYAPADFERDSLNVILSKAGVDLQLPIFFSWLGVTQYLREEAVFETLAQVALSAPGSEIVFEFTVTDDSLDEADRRLVEDYARRAEGFGEPWLSRFDPEVIENELLRLGFSDVKMTSLEEAMNLYCSDRREPPLLDPWRLAHARR